MHKLHRLIPVLCGTLLVMLTLGCCSESRKTYRIGVSQCSSDDWRSKMNDEIRREMLLHEDADIEIRSADDSSEKQIADIKYFLDNDFDIIIAAPNEMDALSPVIAEVYKRGVPVVLFDRTIHGDTYTAHIEVDNEQLGASAAQYVSHLLGPGVKALEIKGLGGSSPAALRHKGFQETFARNGGEVVASAEGKWNQETAEAVMDSMLRLHPEAQVVFAHNDRMAIGASNAARRAGRKDIKVIGVDGAPEIGIKAVTDSIIDATFLYPTEGHLLVQTALKILKGEPYERETLLPASSAVDRSNADILLIQDRSLKAETDRMLGLKTQIDDFWARHSAQTSLFYASIVILVLLFGLVFVMLRSFWAQRRHQEALLEKNRLLEEERDKQKELNDRLEEATQTKLTFFTNVSHDLRTPLTLIAEPVAQMQDAPNLTPRQQTLMKIADKNVRILHRLINQILDFRKYENSRLDLNPEEVDLNRVIPDWMDSFYALARKRDLHLSFEGPSDKESPLPVAMDVEKIERVFFNLLSNAFKHTPANGSITVAYGVKDDTLTLSVSDTGEGIGEEDIDKIFDRFYQVDRVHPHGSGIGLSLSKAFIEMHGGTISVESTPGKGSVFTVRMPVRHVAAEVTDHEKSISQADVQAELTPINADITFDSDRPLVLVIDDNRDIRQLVGELLNDNYNVITASDGVEGVKRAVKYVPDLIICDVMMPVMDGLECCRRLKQEVATSHIPVLMLTACTMDEQRVQGYESGADGYLSKPFSGAVLKARCESLIANRKRIRELWSAPVPQAAAPAPAPASVKKEMAPGGRDIDSDFYRRFLEIFTPEMGNSELSVDGLASRMGLERTQFYRKIKSLTNYSPVELMRTLRLNKARTLLTTTDTSISEIGYAVGFSTPAYFTKCYRTAYGETPTETREHSAGK
ncbi:MAG: substrate-binding domain-containing protein [Muribaculaceae bacterium]|nr:substrate-binding domain-containing protein [Muribaculaceae bacterium]